jgi:hypothetical protein
MEDTFKTEDVLKFSIDNVEKVDISLYDNDKNIKNNNFEFDISMHDFIENCILTNYIFTRINISTLLQNYFKQLINNAHFINKTEEEINFKLNLIIHFLYILKNGIYSNNTIDVVLKFNSNIEYKLLKLSNKMYDSYKFNINIEVNIESDLKHNKYDIISVERCSMLLENDDECIL